MAQKEEFSIGDLRVRKVLTEGGAQASNVTDVATDLEEAYETPELDSEAKLITAINATNANVNANATAINSILAALEGIGLMASS